MMEDLLSKMIENTFDMGLYLYLYNAVMHYISIKETLQEKLLKGKFNGSI